MLGLVSYSTGTRPSSLFNWDESDDWCERLMFDAMVLSEVVPKLLGIEQAGGVLNGRRGNSQDIS